MSRELPDEIMRERREERLKRLCAFMLDKRLAPLNMGREATHNLLTGWFSNSHWRTAIWCVRLALRNSWERGYATAQFWYWRKMLGLSETQIEDRITAE